MNLKNLLKLFLLNRIKTRTIVRIKCINMSNVIKAVLSMLSAQILVITTCTHVDMHVVFCTQVFTQCMSWTIFYTSPYAIIEHLQDSIT